MASKNNQKPKLLRLHIHHRYGNGENNKSFDMVYLDLDGVEESACFHLDSDMAKKIVAKLVFAFQLDEKDE